MTQNIIKGLVALGVVVVLAFGGYALLHSGPSFGGGAYEALPKWFGNGLQAGSSQQLAVDNAGNLTTTGTLTLGTSGTALNQTNSGFCDLNFGTTTSAIAASSTVPVDCQGTNMLASASATQSALSGIAAWSASALQRVRVDLASSTPALGMGVWLDGCSASTTAGYITCRLTNGTGATLTPATTTTHWAQYSASK